ncbi:SDR family oxidoreductase [Cupriavidus basilensis]
MDANISTHARKSAIVTGASRGIRRAIALRLAADGFDVAVGYAGNTAQAEATVAAIRDAGSNAIAVRADVARPEDVARMFDAALAAFGRVDVVVNNAGVMPMANISVENLEAFDRTIATNLRGTFLVLSQAASHLSAGGRIIALSTSVIARSFPGYGPYIASKAGVEGWCACWPTRCAGAISRSMLWRPGPVATELFLEGKSPAQIEQMAKLPPLERLGTPEDIAAVVSFWRGPMRDGSMRRCCGRMAGSPDRQGRGGPASLLPETAVRQKICLMPSIAQSEHAPGAERLSLDPADARFMRCGRPPSTCSTMQACRCPRTWWSRCRS